MQLFRRPTASERRPSPALCDRPFALTAAGGSELLIRVVPWSSKTGIVVAPSRKCVYTRQTMPIRVVIAGEDEESRYVGGVHKRPPIPDNSLKAECPKFMAHGPCGGVRKGGFCEVYPEMTCPWITMFIELEKIGHTDWMKQV